MIVLEKQKEKSGTEKSEKVSENAKKITLKGLLHPLVSAIVLALALYFAAWIANYANTSFYLESFYWENFAWFIQTNLWVFFGFTLVYGYWQYFYETYSEQLHYIKPLFHTIEIMFGSWFIVELFSGLMIFFGVSPALGFFKEFYYTQFWLIAVFVAAAAYAKLFLKK